MLTDLAGVQTLVRLKMYTYGKDINKRNRRNEGRGHGRKVCYYFNSVKMESVFRRQNERGPLQK